MTIHFKVLAKFNGRLVDRAYFVTDMPMARRAALQDGAQAVYRIKRVKQNWLTQQVIGNDYAMLLLRAINFQTESGVPPGKAVQVAIESESDPQTRARLQGALDALSRGAPLSDALYATGFYDTTIKAILIAGERTSGGNAIASAMEYLEDRQAVWKSYSVIISALSMEISTALGVPPTIHEYAVPYIRENLPKTSVEDLARYTAQLDTLAFNNLLWMWISFGFCFLVLLLCVAWFSNPKAKDWITKKILIKIPMIGVWYTNDALQRSCKTFSSMLLAGVRINDAIQTILVSTSNSVTKRFWKKSNDSLSMGSLPGAAFASTGLLRKDEILVLNSARGNAQLARVFLSMSKDRAWRQKILAAKIFRMSILMMFVYIGITLLICFRLFTLFNSGLDMSMSSMTKGI